MPLPQVQWIFDKDPRAEKPLRDCPACNSDQKQSVGKKNGFELVTCSSCSSLYTTFTPWYTSEMYYQNYYDGNNSEQPSFVAKRLLEIVAEFLPYKKTNQMLDLGCGAGGFMHAARASGWNVKGIDVSEPTVQHLREQGFEVFHGELSQLPTESEQFDVITAAELVEHLTDPAALLREAYRLLRPGGVIWLTTPNGRGLSQRLLRIDWSVICPPEHMQLFSIVGLQSLLRATGFREMRTKSSGTNPFEILHKWQPQKPDPAGAPQDFDRVASSYSLNENLNKNRTRRVLKQGINRLLSLTQMGDTISIMAIR
jgi:2-polyprenyl-3-methyl-5-hydroxy-6-metoxy-1,4-benzoquinol methylase